MLLLLRLRASASSSAEGRVCGLRPLLLLLLLL